MANTKKYTDAQLRKAMARVYRKYRNRPNFTGADIGYRWNGDEKTDEKVVRVHVTAKLPVEEIRAEELFPEEIDGVPLDIIEGQYKQRCAIGNRQDRVPTLVGGVSVGREDNSAGTLGAIVVDEEKGWVGVLSNWHVLAGARAGFGDAILQPGRADGGQSRDRIATLSRWMLNLHGDAAVAQLNDARPWLPYQVNSSVLLEGTRNSRLNEVLVKQGRTTGRTSARVDGEGIYRVIYEVRPNVFEPRDIEGFKLVPEDENNPDDIEISEDGDSGGVWYNPSDNKAIGLHFAGEQESNPLAERAIACNMPKVLDKLGVRLANAEDLAGQLENLFDIAVQEGAGPEFTPRPDWPNWPPVPPQWPRPWQPHCPWVGKFPMPIPGHGSSRVPVNTPLSDPRDFDMPLAGYQGFGLSIESRVADPVTRMLELLIASLHSVYPNQFSGLDEFTPIDSLFTSLSRSHLAQVIRKSGLFVNVIPRGSFPKGSFFNPDVTLGNAGTRLADTYL